MRNANRFPTEADRGRRDPLRYQRVDARYAVVSVARGETANGPSSSISRPTCPPPSGAILEEFEPAQPLLFFNANQAARAYRTHSDRYDFLPSSPTCRPTSAATCSRSTSGSATRPAASEGAVRLSGAGIGGRARVDPRAQQHPSLLADGEEAARSADPTRPGFPIDEGIFFDRLRLLGKTDDGLFGRNFGVLNLWSQLADVADGPGGGPPLADDRRFHPQTGVGPDSFDLLLVERRTGASSITSSSRRPSSPARPRASSVQGNAIRDLGPTEAHAPRRARRASAANRKELVDGYGTRPGPSI